jgi:hypothetical protein
MSDFEARVLTYVLGNLYGSGRANDAVYRIYSALDGVVVGSVINPPCRFDGTAGVYDNHNMGDE